MNWRSVVLLVALAGIGFPTAAHAQYFGQNKVQYDQFDFKVLQTEHFDIYFYPEEEAAVQLAARMAERWYARLSKLLRHELNGRQPLILYAAHPHFQQTNVLGGAIGEGTGGVTESARRRIILPFAGGLAETDHVLGHELVHAFQYDIAAGNGNTGMSAMAQLPLWFIEGMAEYLSVGPIDANTSMWIRDASAREKMPTVKRLDHPDFFPYRYGHAFWAYVAARWGDRAVGDMLFAGTRAGSSVETAMEAVLNIDHETFTQMWHDDTRRTYAGFLEATQPASAFGKPFMSRESGGGEINIAPALSPDGRRVVFLSERSLFSINMYVAEVATGKITRKLVETAGDPHFESLQFIESAGDWAPDNQRFVFAALSKGRPVLSIVNVDTGRREAEYPFPDLDQVFNPAWSPDGGRIVFSAMRGGVLDLWMFDVASRQTTQLTNDPFADYDPEWAPDGRAIAWVTDRFSARPEVLDFGGYRIGLLTLPAGEARQVASFEFGRMTNPEFSADGQALYFIGTPEGIPNVYRVSVAGGAPAPVTNMHAGVSGITHLTPALSLAANADTMIFTAFEDNHYNLYVTQPASQASARVASLSGRNAAVLPPGNRGPSDVAQMLETPAAGLPTQTEFPEEEYKAGLGLEGVMQPSVGVGVDRFGAYAGGGVGFLFRDMLGNHELGTFLQITNRLEEVGGAVTYINRQNRWNWGLSVERTPYLTGGFDEFLTTYNGQLAIAQQELRLTQVNTGVSGVLQYPFSRAHRMEFNAGVRRISFTNRVQTFVYSATTGQFIDEIEEKLPSSDPINLGEGSAALVYDTSVFGAASPILGQRYRLEYSHSAGTLDYSGVLTDYRRYFMPARPFTIAFRGMHYGRYGGSAEDGRLGVIDLGYPGLVRGYDYGSFEVNECGPSIGITGECPVFDQLIGSRIAVANAELRFPLWGVFSRSSYYGPLPLEVALFGDAGVAWTSREEPQFLGGDRDWVRSVGAGLRFNLFGYLIGEIDYVKPIDRPEKGWHWQFNFIPGF
jgi:Tol biopolymer transport system component